MILQWTLHTVSTRPSSSSAFLPLESSMHYNPILNVHFWERRGRRVKGECWMVCFCCSDSNEVSNEELSAAQRDQRPRDSVETQYTHTHTLTSYIHTNTPAWWRLGNYHPPPITAAHTWWRLWNLSAMCGSTCDVVAEALTDMKQSS